MKKADIVTLLVVAAVIGGFAFIPGAWTWFNETTKAYGLFREDYHASIGRKAFLRLNRLGQREERIHGYGFTLSYPVSFGRDDGGTRGKTRVRILGLVGISYCRGLGCWDWPGNLSEDEFERWLDWALSRGSGALRTVGKDKSGRTNKRLKARYR